MPFNIIVPSPSGDMLLVKILDKFFLGTFIPGRLNALHDFRPYWLWKYISWALCMWSSFMCIKVASGSVLEKLLRPRKVSWYAAYFAFWASSLRRASISRCNSLLLWPRPWTKGVGIFASNAESRSSPCRIPYFWQSSADNFSSLASTLLSYLLVLFFQTKLYLLAFASILVPSTNKWSNLISPISWSFFTSWTNSASAHSGKRLLLNLAISW